MTRATVVCVRSDFYDVADLDAELGHVLRIQPSETTPDVLGERFRNPIGGTEGAAIHVRFSRCSKPAPNPDLQALSLFPLLRYALRQRQDAPH